MPAHPGRKSRRGFSRPYEPLSLVVSPKAEAETRRNAAPSAEEALTFRRELDGRLAFIAHP